QASVVEFHVVFSKEQFGPDSGSSITFDEASLVSSFRNLLPELYDSNYDKDVITEQLFEVRSKFGRGLALKENLPKGNLITEDMLTLKKPLGPLTWNDRKSVIGKKANKDLKSWNHLNLEDFD
ncbi:N-acetylneuraminate synthase, partial [bacterium]|nr:N-acetylneuraminate synthase [bacterium]